MNKNRCLLSRSVALLEKTPVSIWMLPLCHICLNYWKFDKKNWWEFLNHKTCISIFTLEFCCYRKKLKKIKKYLKNNLKIMKIHTRLFFLDKSYLQALSNKKNICSKLVLLPAKSTSKVTVLVLLMQISTWIR